MSGFEVVTGSLRQTAGRAQSVGGRLVELGGHARGIRSPGEPKRTSASLERFASTWSAGVADLGHGVRGIGLSTDAAASLYDVTDRGAMPQ
ncbi:MAG TPA: hypothetical protein VGF25_08320 [Thermoleophilaceae bacterium]|jgi:hypothetical protein